MPRSFLQLTTTCNTGIADHFHQVGDHHLPGRLFSFYTTTRTATNGINIKQTGIRRAPGAWHANFEAADNVVIKIRPCHLYVRLRRTISLLSFRHREACSNASVMWLFAPSDLLARTKLSLLAQTTHRRRLFQVECRFSGRDRPGPLHHTWANHRSVELAFWINR